MQYTKEQLEAMEKAAPDMLEALELLMDDLSLNHHINLNNMIGGSTREVLSKAIAAIDKAKGESK